MTLAVTVVIFIAIVLAIVLVTRNLMITSIRRMAVYLRWNNNVIGQLLGYATSTPELINAMVAGSIGMISASVFNIISANVVNIVNVIILTLYFKRTKSVLQKKFKLDYLLVIVSVLTPIFLLLTGFSSSLLAIFFFIILYVIFLLASSVHSYFEAEHEQLEIDETAVNVAERKLKGRNLSLERKKKVRKSIVTLIISLALLYFLGNCLGTILETLGNEFKMPGFVLGIMMGFITSIPELITFMSSYHRHSRYKSVNQDKGALEVVNNLVTSNISNLCIIQSVAILSFILFAR